MIQHLQYYKFQNDNSGNFVAKDEMLSGCFPKNAYFILKQNLNFDENSFWTSYTNNIGINIHLNNNGKLHFFSANSNNDNKYIIFDRISAEPEESLHILKHRLENKMLTSIQCIYQLMPYSKFYDPSFDYLEYQGGHANVFIYMDKNYYYYFDTPFNLNMKSVQKIKNNNEVYKVERLIADEVFKHFLVLYNISTDENEVQNLNRKVYERIKSFADEFVNEQSQNSYFGNSFSCYTGFTAMLKLKQICQENYIDLNAQTPHIVTPSSIGDHLTTEMLKLQSNRKLLSDWLRNNNTKDATQLIVKLYKSYEKWGTFKQAIRRRMLGGNNMLDLSYISPIDSIIETDRLLYSEILKYMEGYY